MNKRKPNKLHNLRTVVSLLLICVLVLGLFVSGALSSTAYAADSTISLGAGLEDLRPGEPTWYNSIEDQYGQLWVADTQVDIFKIEYENGEQQVTVAGKNSSKVIAPGTENSYSFAIKNTAGGMLNYKVIVEAWVSGGSTRAAIKLPVQARMQGLDWLVGGESEWANVLELNGAEESGYVESYKHVLYNLQWQWPFEQDLNGDGSVDDGDALDTWLATQGNITLTIKINVAYSYAFPEQPGINAPIPDYFDADSHNAYLYGFPDGTIRPEYAITRAETAAVFYRLLKSDVRNQYRTDICAYSDVESDAWYTTEIATLSAMGILQGYPDGSFHPNDLITRAEMACILARFSGEEGDGKGKTEFTDIEDHWAEKEIMLVEDFKWIEGYPDGAFGPGNNISRAETATMVNRMLHRLPEKLSDLLPRMQTWPDNADKEAWYYIAIQEASNSHTYQRLLGTREKWISLLDLPEILSN